MPQFSLWQVLVLAVVQGVTEFLPVSSDGHLALVEPLLWNSSQPRPESLDLTIILHLGTLGSILVFYRRQIAELLTSDRHVLWLIFLGTLPLVFLVLPLKVLLGDDFDVYLKNVRLTGFMLPLTGAALLWSSHSGGGNRDYRQLRWWDSLLIGLAQAAAILPGLSRSGSTISAALGLGLARRAATSYSFLLAIPALAGAGGYETLSILRHGAQFSAAPAHLAIGAAVSFVVGLAALTLLSRVVQRGRLQYFGWYCIALGVIVLVFNWSK
jgi:undecaprenyl-diphosphatase